MKYEIIDVPTIEPRLKHPTIFQKFDDLKPDNGIIIDNDHDPKPLYYQLLAERGPVFTWEYIENGPERWKVKLVRKSEGQKESIGEMVAKDFRKAEVFKRFGIDFCCGGKKSLKETCEKKGLDIVEVERQLLEIDKTINFRNDNIEKGPLSDLINHIILKHHKYVKESLPVMEEFLSKVARVHGHNHPEMVQAFDLFLQVKEELIPHMYKEEQILFPYIKNMEIAKSLNAEGVQPPFGTVNNPVRMMEMEHEKVGEVMAEISRVTNAYEPPVDACATYRVSLSKLKEFEDDLHVHIHLENNILFPRSIELEKTFKLI